MSNFNDIVNRIVAGVAGLTLLDPNSDVIPVVNRKEVEKNQTLDPPYQITIDADPNPDKVTPFAFGWFKKTYLIRVDIIAPNDGDPISNRPLYTNWREQIVDLLQMPPGPLAGLTVVIDLDVKPEGFLPRSGTGLLYDEQCIAVLVTTVETA